MTESRMHALKSRFFSKGIWMTVLQFLKWAAVVWCLWPMARLSESGLPLTRVVVGITFFVIFAGKLLYDTLIADYVRQRRTTLKQDIAALIGMVIGVMVLIGLVLAMVAALLVETGKQSMTP